MKINHNNNQQLPSTYLFRQRDRKEANISEHTANKEKSLKTYANIFQNKNSSIQSIHRARKQSSLLLDETCPLGVLRKHLNKSLDQIKRLNSKQGNKQSAYIFFEDQRRRKMQVQKHQNYLLPKICRKSIRKIDMKENIQEIQTNEQHIYKKNRVNSKANEAKLPRLYKQTLAMNQTSLQSSELAQKLSIFKKKCDIQLQQVKLTLPKQIRRKKKCFFELSQRQVDELYEDKQIKNNSLTQSFGNNSSTNSNHQQEQNAQKIEKVESQTCKFKQIKIKSPETEQTNPNVPNFLLQRLSIIDNFGQNRAAMPFLTDSILVDIFISPKKKFNEQKLATCPSYAHLR